jgi:hypothetical protein
MPTRKWWATQVTALTGLALMYVTTGGWDQEESIGLITIISQAALAWLVPNKVGSSGLATDEGQPTTLA